METVSPRFVQEIQFTGSPKTTTTTQVTSAFPSANFRVCVWARWENTRTCASYLWLVLIRSQAKQIKAGLILGGPSWLDYVNHAQFLPTGRELACSARLIQAGAPKAIRIGRGDKIGHLALVSQLAGFDG